MSRWKYQLHVGVMNSPVILGHNRDVNEFSISPLYFILFNALKLPWRHLSLKWCLNKTKSRWWTRVTRQGC